MLKTMLWGGEVLEDWRIKIAVLWLLHNLAGLFVGVVMLMEPGVLEGIMAGEILGMQIGPEVFIIVTIEFLVPFFMAFLSLTLKDSINRWANIIVGAVFTVIGLVELGDAVAKLSAYASLMWLSIVVVTALIVWYAWKSKQKA